jgi:hypothetical protein
VKGKTKSITLQPVASFHIIFLKVMYDFHSLKITTKFQVYDDYVFPSILGYEIFPIKFVSSMGCSHKEG